MQLAAQLTESAYLIEQMRESKMTLIRHCAGSSATAIVTASQLWRTTIARVQGCLHMRTLTPKRLKETGGTGNVTKVTQRALVAWESHLRDASEKRGRDGRGGGDG